jgi:hypothetical protein
LANKWHKHESFFGHFVLQQSRLVCGFADAVLIIPGNTIVIIFVHRGIGPSLLRRSQLTLNALLKGLAMADDDRVFIALMMEAVQTSETSINSY